MSLPLPQLDKIHKASPHSDATIKKVADYLVLGLNDAEISKLLDIHITTVKRIASYCGELDFRSRKTVTLVSKTIKYLLTHGSDKVKADMIKLIVPYQQKIINHVEPAGTQAPIQINISGDRFAAPTTIAPITVEGTTESQS